LRDRNRTRVLFVCLANICRSPTAEGVFRQQVKQAGLSDRIAVDSAGTGAYHIGDPPDPRACRVASQRGYDLTRLRARQVDRNDFAEFDYIVVMDLDNMRALAPLCPPEHGHKVKLFTDYCSTGGPTISDPYTRGPEDFALMLDRIEDGADGLLRHIIREIEA
jgi:protein-tyrosine phosphatase